MFLIFKLLLISIILVGTPLLVSITYQKLKKEVEEAFDDTDE